MIKCALSLLIIATCIVGEVKLCKDLNVQLADLQNKLGVYAKRENKSLEEGTKHNVLNDKFIELNKKLGACEERDRKSLEIENKYNELNDKFIELNKKLAVYEYREKGFEEGNIELKTKIANLQNDLGLYKERERKSLEEGNMCNELNATLAELPRILLNLQEREKKGIEEMNKSKQLNEQLGEVQQKLADCEEREKNCLANNSKAESKSKASLEKYRVKISELESSNLALNTSNQKLKEDLEQRYNYKWPYKNTCLTQRPGVGTTGSVEIEGMESFPVRCVNDLNSGPGWMLIQKRIETWENNLFYHRYWSEYRDGFSYDNGGFFIGLEKLYRLTNAVPHELYIDMEEWGGNKKFAHYDNFRVGNESEQYPLKDLGNYTGNAGDALRDNNNMKFSTIDQDNDNSPDVDCTRKYSSGWWHNNCTKANLNGFQYTKYMYEEGGIWWHSHVGLKNVRMLIRPKVKK